MGETHVWRGSVKTQRADWSPLGDGNFSFLDRKGHGGARVVLMG